METIILRPAEPECDFGQLTTWFSELENEITTESELKAEHKRGKERILLKLQK